VLKTIDVPANYGDLTYYCRRGTVAPADKETDGINFPAFMRTGNLKVPCDNKNCFAGIP